MKFRGREEDPGERGQRHHGHLVRHEQQRQVTHHQKGYQHLESPRLLPVVEAGLVEQLEGDSRPLLVARPQRERRREVSAGAVSCDRDPLRGDSESRRPAVDHDSLGASALLAQVPPDSARDNADVAAIARVADAPEDLETLDALGATGSLRRAADLLHLHHSSVARRLEQIGRTLGFELTEPAGLLRANLGLTTWRLLDS